MHFAQILCLLIIHITGGTSNKLESDVKNKLVVTFIERVMKSKKLEELTDMIAQKAVEKTMKRLDEYQTDIGTRHFRAPVNEDAESDVGESVGDSPEHKNIFQPAAAYEKQTTEKKVAETKSTNKEATKLKINIKALKSMADTASAGEMSLKFNLFTKKKLTRKKNPVTTTSSTTASKSVATTNSTASIKSIDLGNMDTDSFQIDEELDKDEADQLMTEVTNTPVQENNHNEMVDTDEDDLDVKVITTTFRTGKPSLVKKDFGKVNQINNLLPFIEKDEKIYPLAPNVDGSQEKLAKALANNLNKTVRFEGKKFFVMDSSSDYNDYKDELKTKVTDEIKI